jgi:hypothetical protein
MNDMIVAEAIDGLLDARRMIAKLSGATSASDIVRQVLDGKSSARGASPTA